MGPAPALPGSSAAPWPRHELEEALAAFKGTQAALTFSTGYAAAIGTICALLDSNDVSSVESWSMPALWTPPVFPAPNCASSATTIWKTWEENLRWATAEARLA